MARVPMGSTDIGTPDLLAYGGLALPLAFAGLPFYIHAPDFYLRFHGIGLAVMGTILLGIRLIDAVQDPLIGRFSDVFATRRLTIILLALGLLGLGFALLYNPPAALPPVPWFCGSMLIAALGFSTLTINLNALGSLWSKDSVDKTRIAATREGLGLIGLLLATLLPTLLQLRLPPPAAFRIYAGVFLALTLLTGWVFYRWGRRHAFIAATPVPLAAFSYRSYLALLRPPFAWFFGAYGLSMLASSIPGVLVLLFIRDRLGAEQLTGLFLVIYFLAGVLGMPVWQRVSVSLGKQKTWLLAMGVAVASFVWADRLQAGDTVAYGIICLLSGLALGAELVLPPSIISDLIDRNGAEHDTGSLFAIMHFLSKLALALASGGAFLLLDRFGYVPGQALDGHSLAMLSAVYALVPCIIKAAAAAVVFVMFRKERRYAHS